jgi:hypothetical protein
MAGDEHSKGFASMFGSFPSFAVAGEFAGRRVAEFQQVNAPPHV